MFYILGAGVFLFFGMVVRENVRGRYLEARAVSKILDENGGELFINESTKLTIKYKTMQSGFRDKFTLDVLINGKVAQRFEENLFFRMHDDNMKFNKPWKKDIERKLKESYLAIKRQEKHGAKKEKYFKDLKQKAFASEYKSSK